MTETEDQKELQNYLEGLSFKVRRKLVEAIKREADRLAEAIKAAAPVRTGALRDSIKVRRRRGDLDLVVTAGGDATTKEIRDGSGVAYDYVMATEFGTSKQPAEPFFYSTYRQMQESITENIQRAVEEALNA